MEWTYVALLQMALITIGVSSVCVFFNRKLSGQNKILRERVAELDATEPPPPGPTPEEWSKDYIANLDETPANQLIAAILHNATQGVEGLADQLPELLEKADLVGVDQAELEAALARVAELESADGDGTDELKQLLQQFTHDCRELTLCIGQLEQENAELRAQLEGSETAQPNASEPPVLDAENAA
ncbi:MAG: hypothetical protein AAF529_12065 [Pseudomonadota bacterium]